MAETPRRKPPTAGERKAGVATMASGNMPTSASGPRDTADPVDTLASMEARLARLQARLDELDADVERQRREKKEPDIEIAIRKGTLELLGKEPGADPENPAGHEKTLLVKQTSEKLGVTAGSLLPVVGVARGTYHCQPDAMKRPDKDSGLLELVREAFENSKRRYGYKRVHLELRGMGIVASAKRIMGLMTRHGLVPLSRSAKRHGSYKGELTKAPANLVDGDFHAERPNMPWVTNLTEFSIPAGKACPSPVIDCHDGMPVAWTIGTSPDSALANGMLADACSTLKDGEKPIIHSDHGCRYRWPGWIRIRKDDDLTRSTGAKGCSPDNAAAEGFLGRPRQEFFHKRSFAGVSMDGFINMLNDYMARYRDKRIKTESGHGHHEPSTQTRSCGIIGGDGINDESNKTAPSPSSEGASGGTRTHKPKRSILSRLRIPFRHGGLPDFRRLSYCTLPSEKTAPIIEHNAIQQTMFTRDERVDGLAVIGLGRLAHFGEHAAPDHSAATDHIDTARMNRLVCAAFGSGHAQESVIHCVRIFKAQSMAIDHGVIVFLQSHGQGGHGGHRTGHADDGTCLASVHSTERLIDMLVDIGYRLINLRLCGRIGDEMAFGHAHGSDIHGKCTLHLCGGGVHAITADHQFSGAASQINHQIGCRQIISVDYGSGTQEAEIGFFGTGNDFRTDTKDALDAILKFLTILGIARGRGGHESQAVDRMLGEYAGELTGGFIRAFQCFVGKTMSLVHVLTESNHPQDAGYDFMHAVGVHARDFQSDGVRAAINTGNGYGFLAHCFPLLLVRTMAHVSCVESLLSPPASSDRGRGRTHP